MLVTYSYWPHSEPRSTTASLTQASSMASSSSLAHASTMRSPCKAGRSGGGREGRRWAVDLESVAEELYTLHPTEFVGARTARVEAALAAGKAALAAQIAALKRPTLSAWAGN